MVKNMPSTIIDFSQISSKSTVSAAKNQNPNTNSSQTNITKDSPSAKTGAAPASKSTEISFPPRPAVAQSAAVQSRFEPKIESDPVVEKPKIQTKSTEIKFAPRSSGNEKTALALNSTVSRASKMPAVEAVSQYNSQTNFQASPQANSSVVYKNQNQQLQNQFQNQYQAQRYSQNRGQAQTFAARNLANNLLESHPERLALESKIVFPALPAPTVLPTSRFGQFSKKQENLEQKQAQNQHQNQNKVQFKANFADFFQEEFHRALAQFSPDYALAEESNIRSFKQALSHQEKNMLQHNNRHSKNDRNNQNNSSSENFKNNSKNVKFGKPVSRGLNSGILANPNFVFSNQRQRLSLENQRKNKQQGLVLQLKSFLACVPILSMLVE